jgi:hypothetical protein
MSVRAEKAKEKILDAIASIGAAMALIPSPKGKNLSAIDPRIILADARSILEEVLAGLQGGADE